MDNEKYGIELELITNKFKQKMQEVKSSFSSITDKKVNLNANTAQIEYLKRQIGELTADLQVNAKTKFWNDTETLKAQAQLEKLTNQYNGLIAKQNAVQKSSTKSSENISRGLERMTSKIKRFGLALLSIRSIYALVSRASSAYLAQDTELANKLQSAWVGLGSVLAPIINFIATLILKLVSVINGFIKTMTGVDLISKASSKSMKGAAGSANSLKKALAGFDELQNLDSDTSGGAGGIGGLLDPFDTIDEDWDNITKQISKAIDKFKDNFIKRAKDSVEDIKRTMKKLGLSEAFIETYSFAADGGIKFLQGFVDAFKGILQTLNGILTLNEQEVIEGLKTFVNGIWEILSGLGQFVVGLIGLIGVALWDGIKAAWNWIADGTSGIQDTIDVAINWIEGRQEQQKRNLFSTLNSIGGWFSSLWNGVKSGASSAWNWIGYQIELQKINFRLWINTISNWFSNLWNNIINGFAKTWNKIADAANKVSIANALGIGKLPRINSYAVGTNYVPEDQLAFIHKGEAVVPKKYNNGGYVSQSNDETNDLLKELINRVENIEINPYTTIKDVGKASLSYINNKSRQLGESVVV